MTDLSPLAPERCPPHVGMAALRQDPGRPEAETCPPRSEDMACDSGGHVGGHSPAGTAGDAPERPPTPLRVARTARAEAAQAPGAPPGPPPP